MTTRFQIALIFGLIVGWASPVLAADAANKGAIVAKPNTPAPKTLSSPADLPFAAAIEKMQQQVPAAPTGNPDRDYTSNAISVTQGTIDLAEAELKYGKDGDLKKLAQSMIDQHKREIAALQKWRKAHPK